MSDTYCGATTNTGFELLNCDLTRGHDGPHQRAGYSWPRELSPEQSIEDRITGRQYDDLFLELFQRVAKLEQLSTRPTASCASEELRRGLGEVERRMTRLEGGGSQPGHHDLSAFQAGLMRHMNRSLSELGQGIEQRHIDLRAKIDELREFFAPFLPLIRSLVPEPVEFCNAPSLHGGLHCEKEPGHDGRHESGNTSWPVQCPATHPETGAQCVNSRGHRAAHNSDPRGISHRARWTEPDTLAQTERVSGSPAAVRCPTRFREGQCMGYAGHDGECSTVPGDGPQMEEAGEFDMCGAGYPDSIPPCGLQAGHDGPHASGPDET